MKKQSQWAAQDISTAKFVGILDFQDNKGEFHDFEVLETDDKYIIGGSTNNSFLQSGYMLKEDCDACQLLEEIETYYNDGPHYVTSLVVNERM